MQQLTDATLVVNNEAVGIVPNSLKYTEGFGEQQVRPVSIGGGKTEQVFARNLETNFSKVMFELHTTPENVALARRWKANGNANVISIAGETSDGKNVTRTFNRAAIVNDYEVQIGSDTNIAIEAAAEAAI